MKPILSIIKMLAVSAAGPLFFFCSSAVSLSGGNSSQTGNSGIMIASSVKSIYGATVPDAHVAIYEESFKPYATPSGFCDSTVADDSGRFVIPIAREGYFNLYVNDVRRGNAGFIHRIPVFADSVFIDTIDTLKQPGFISGNVTDTAGKIYALAFVFIQGSPFYTVTKNNGDFLLGPLPEGKYAAPGIVAGPTGINPVGTPDFLTNSVSIDVFPDSISQWK